MSSRIESWGRLPRSTGNIHKLNWRDELLPMQPGDAPALPFGLGRSYGDSCLNEGGTLLFSTGLGRFISLDRKRGVLRAESGVSLDTILELIVPTGWFLPVTPGTKFVTLGGAIANDVHGKNHHIDGTFGRFVLRFELLRSSGERLLCSPEENVDLYRATIGGLGLTGLITWVELQLRPIYNPGIDSENIRFRHVDEFFELSEESADHYDYQVAWVDCLARGKSLGRGHFIRGNHAGPQPEGARSSLPAAPSKKLSVPFVAPPGLINRFTVKVFNTLYYHRQQRQKVSRLVHYEPFFYPLDAIHHWNRVYGPKGFYQYQCVVPFSGGSRSIHVILDTIAKSGQGSPLVVLKTFGKIPSPGLLSFPREGVTLALDFPNKGARTLELFNRLDALVRDAGGAVYPAKDARMSQESFKAFFPQWEALEELRDPAFSSSFWRRVTGTSASAAPSEHLLQSSNA